MTEESISTMTYAALEKHLNEALDILADACVPVPDDTEGYYACIECDGIRWEKGGCAADCRIARLLQACGRAVRWAQP